MHKRNVHILVAFVCFILTFIEADGYMPSQTMKDPYISDLLLHEIVNRMGKNLGDVSDSYIEPMPIKEMPSRLSLMARATKDLEAEQLDYDSIVNGERAGHPSMRDQEYLEHSSLFGHQYVTGGTGEIGSHYFKLKPKTDASLPAYCNPPNPCPVGFNEEQGCITEFENTAAFSRDYQASQECMCDGEHMFDCPGPKDSNKPSHQMSTELEKNSKNLDMKNTIHFWPVKSYQLQQKKANVTTEKIQPPKIVWNLPTTIISKWTLISLTSTNVSGFYVDDHWLSQKGLRFLPSPKFSFSL